MASMICKCGKRLTDFEAPNDIQFRVYSDFEWDKILECDTVNTWEIPDSQYQAWKCPECERVYLFNNEKDEAIKVYKLEEG